MEVDSADFRGIDTARELIRNAKYKGLGGGIKVYLLDEVHKFTKDAQEALLKTLEEPPSHVFFILATTDPQLLKPTLVDRCLHCKTEPMSEEDGVKFLKKIIRKEGKQIPDDVLLSILDKSEFRPRSSLALLEKIIDMEPAAMQDAIESDKLLESSTIELARALIKGSSWADVMNIVKGLESEEPEAIRRSVMGYCVALLMKKREEDAMVIAECFERPFYDNGRHDLILACCRVFNALGR
jgi:DNA polymerase III gamma/tau subunit